jgi:hypothetical protein
MYGNRREVHVRLRVEVVRVWRCPAARLSFELPISLPSTPDTPARLDVVFCKMVTIVLAGKDSSRQTPGGHAQTPRPRRIGGNKFAANIHLTREKEKSSAKNLWVHIFLFCQVINVKPLKIVSFHFCHIFLRLSKFPHLSNQLCKIVGDALS